MNFPVLPEGALIIAHRFSGGDLRLTPSALGTTEKLRLPYGTSVSLTIPGVKRRAIRTRPYGTHLSTLLSSGPFGASRIFAECCLLTAHRSPLTAKCPCTHFPP